MVSKQLLFLLILTGFIIVALPDNDVRLFSISKAHGPSLQDAIGLLFILMGYCCLFIRFWRKRKTLFLFKNARCLQAGIFVCGLALGLIIASVANDYPHWWVIGVVLMVIIQAAAVYVIYKTKKKPIN